MKSIKPVVGIIVVVAGAVLVVVSGVSAGRMRIFMRRDVSCKSSNQLSGIAQCLYYYTFSYQTNPLYWIAKGVLFINVNSSW